jgi:uncharacterized protein YjbI with pentapeptide repeats
LAEVDRLRFLEWVNSAGERGVQAPFTDLSGLDLRGLSLGGANLRGANLRGADLRGTFFGDAFLDGADLGDADLRGAQLAAAFVEGVNFAGAKYNASTQWREGARMPDPFGRFGAESRAPAGAVKVE